MEIIHIIYKLRLVDRQWTIQMHVNLYPAK